MTTAVEMKLKKANLPLLIAPWYPFSSAETLKEITYIVYWMYTADDAIFDKVSWPGLDNAAAFEEAYNILMDFVYKSLKLGRDMEKPRQHSSIAAIDSFRLLVKSMHWFKDRNYTMPDDRRISYGGVVESGRSTADMG